MPQTSPPTTPAAILTAAADLLEKQGWFQGGPYDPDAATPERPPSDCPLCVLGAIAVAAGLPPDIWIEWPLGSDDKRDDFLRAVRAAERLAAHLGAETFPLTGDIHREHLVDAAEHYDIVLGSRWNDQAAEGLDQVLAALREAGKAAA